MRLVHVGETTVAHPEASTRLETPVSLLVIAVKAYDLPAAFDRVALEALGGAVILPLQNGLEHVEAIRARVGGPTPTAAHPSPSVAAASIGRVSVSSPEPGVVVQTTHTGAAIRAASRHLEADELADRLAPLAVPGIEVVVGDERGRGPLGEGGAARGARVGDRRDPQLDRPAPRAIRPGALASRRRSPRRVLWQPPTVSSSMPAPNGR